MYILRGHRLYFPNKVVFLSLKIVFVVANSVDPDDMLHNVALHLGSSLFGKYSFSCKTSLLSYEMPIIKYGYTIFIRPDRGVWWLSGRVPESRSRGCGFEAHRRHCILSLSKTLYPLLSTGSTQEDLSRHD